MSRVDEARRRAAKSMGNTATIGGEVFLRPLDGDDVVVLARTLLPVETPQPRPVESPNHGDRQSSTIHAASPFGSRRC